MGSPPSWPACDALPRARSPRALLFEEAEDPARCVEGSASSARGRIGPPSLLFVSGACRARLASLGGRYTSSGLTTLGPPEFSKVDSAPEPRTMNAATAAALANKKPAPAMPHQGGCGFVESGAVAPASGETGSGGFGSGVGAGAVSGTIAGIGRTGRATSWFFLPSATATASPSASSLNCLWHVGHGSRFPN
jgi:hypothetical protein